MNLPATDVEVDVVERKRGGEAFDEAGHGENGGRPAVGTGLFDTLHDRMFRMRLNQEVSSERPGGSAPPGRIRLLDAPDFEIMLLVVVAGDERVLIAALRVNVLFGDQKRRLHESARGLVVEGSVQLVDRLPRLQFDWLRNGHGLILIALADAVIGRAIPVGGDQLRLGRIDTSRTQDGDGEVPIVVADRSRVYGKSEALNPARGQLRLTLRGFRGGRVDIVQHLAAGAF